MPLLAVQLWPEPSPLFIGVKPSVLKDRATSQCLVVWHCKFCRAWEELSLWDLSWDRDKLFTPLTWFKEEVNPSHAGCKPSGNEDPSCSQRSGRKFHPPHHSQQSAASSSQQHSSSGNRIAGTNLNRWVTHFSRPLLGALVAGDHIWEAGNITSELLCPVLGFPGQEKVGHTTVVSQHLFTAGPVTEKAEISSRCPSSTMIPNKSARFSVELIVWFKENDRNKKTKCVNEIYTGLWKYNSTTLGRQKLSLLDMRTTWKACSLFTQHISLSPQDLSMEEVAMMNNAFLFVISSAQTARWKIHSSFSLNRLFLGLLAGFWDPLRNYWISQRSQRAFFSVETKRKRASLGSVGVMEEGSEGAAGTSFCGRLKASIYLGMLTALCHLFT